MTVEIYPGLTVGGSFRPANRLGGGRLLDIA